MLHSSAMQTIVVNPRMVLKFASLTWISMRLLSEIESAVMPPTNAAKCGMSVKIPRMKLYTCPGMRP
jgi:hypothetical protein